MELWDEILGERAAAHTKHHNNSIEAINAGSPRWLPILGEEFGEVAGELTYDKGAKGRLRAELLQVAGVATAWIDAIDGTDRF